MAAPEDNENCHHVQNDPQMCKIKLGKFHCDVLWFYGVIKKSFPRGAESAPPPPQSEVGLKINNINTLFNFVLAKLEEHLHLLSRLVPNWLSIVTVRKCEYVKLAKNADINAVLNQLNTLKKQESGS